MKVAKTLHGHKRMDTTAKVYGIAQQGDVSEAVKALNNKKRHDP